MKNATNIDTLSIGRTRVVEVETRPYTTIGMLRKWS
jgi:hypothetical protein